MTLLYPHYGKSGRLFKLFMSIRFLNTQCQSLHSDVWGIILAKVDPFTREKCALVCQQFNKIVRNRISVVRFSGEIDDIKLFFFQKRFPPNAVQVIWTKGSYVRISRYLDNLFLAGYLRKIIKITLRGGFVEQQEDELAFAKVLEKISTLKVLEIICSNISGKCIPMSSSLCSVIVNDCNEISCLKLPPTVIHLDMSDCKTLKRICASSLRFIRAEGCSIPDIMITNNNKIILYLSEDLRRESKIAIDLLNEYANPDAMSSHNIHDNGVLLEFPPLHHVLSLKQLEYANFLLDRGADPSLGRPNHLFYAAFFGDLDSSRLLLDRGANPNIDKRGLSPLHAAVMEGHLESARLLLERGADPNDAVKNNLSPLHYAIMHEHLECARLLLDHKARLWTFQVLRSFQILASISLFFFRLIFKRNFQLLLFLVKTTFHELLLMSKHVLNYLLKKKG